MSQKILVIGGAGYIGSVLVPKLLSLGKIVTVYDLMIFGNHLIPHPNLNVISGDINDYNNIGKYIDSQDVLINLAVISDDPSQVELAKIKEKTNLGSCLRVAEIARDLGVSKFIYASSTSVYGRQNNCLVDEFSTPDPLTDYGRYKLLCEKHLLAYANDFFCVTCIRPSTVFGYSPRQRFDLLVNNMIASGCINNAINIAGAKKIRPNVHIQDITDFYVRISEADHELVNKEVFNIAYNNITIEETAHRINNALGGNLRMQISNSEDYRSYNVSAKKALQVLEFSPSFSIEDAVADLSNKISNSFFVDPLNNNAFYSRNKKDYTIK